MQSLRFRKCVYLEQINLIIGRDGAYPVSASYQTIRMKRILLLSLIAAFSVAAIYAEAPKREVRAVWLTTAWALDWPTGNVRVPAPIFEADGVTLTPASATARANARTQQQNQLRTILNRLEAANFNTIYFQVRPMSDAFFRSSFEPWSHWLSSVRGADPGWSPLGWLIEEAHARGMEVHAWLNPYRYSSSTATFFNTHPLDHANPANNRLDWLMDYTGIGNHHAGSRILNPGIPAVRELIFDIVEELITNYNLDGIVFDDYFYQSGTTTAMDDAQFRAYNPWGFPDTAAGRAAWRREQIHLMVAGVQERINEVAPWVQWGLSPAGVAMGANIPQHYRDERELRRPSPGNDWQWTSLHADPVGWLQRGIIDYISPQVYWPISNDPATDYERIMNWWAEVSNQFGRHLFSSNTATMSAVTDHAETRAQMIRQVEVNRAKDLNDAPGFVLFRDGTGHARGVYTALRNNVFQHLALPANFGWKPAPMQGLVSGLTLTGQNLSWTYTNTDTRPFQSPFNQVRYAIYAVPNASAGNAGIFTSPRYLAGISYTTNFTLPAGVSAGTHTIGVAVFDRFGNLFPVRTLGGANATIAPATLTFPANGATDVVIPSIFTWNAVSGAYKYVWQLSYDASFENPIVSRETTVPYFNIGRQGNIREGVTYYWRVITMAVNAPPVISAVYSFTGTSFSILTPGNNETGVSVTPEITWLSLGAGANYVLEISMNQDFNTIIYTASINETSVTVSTPLRIGTAYFARVRGSAGTINIQSRHIRFTTDLMLGQVPVPTILSPTDGESIDGNNITVEWEEQVSRGFRVQMHQNPSFPLSGRQQRDVAHDAFNVTFSGLIPGTWYIRMQAQELNTAGSAVWGTFSGAISVELGGQTSLCPGVNVNRVPVAFYTIMGIRLGQEPQSGIFIVRYDDGSVERVMR